MLLMSFINGRDTMLISILVFFFKIWLCSLLNDSLMTFNKNMNKVSRKSMSKSLPGGSRTKIKVLLWSNVTTFNKKRGKDQTIWTQHPSGGSKGPQTFLNFMQFFGKFGKIVCWRPLLRGILGPPFHPLTPDKISESPQETITQNQSSLPQVVY